MCGSCDSKVGVGSCDRQQSGCVGHVTFLFAKEVSEVYVSHLCTGYIRLPNEKAKGWVGLFL